MNKKVKITLLSLMLGASLAGIATTIVSCSASSTNEIKIEHSSTLVSNITKDLTQFFDKNESYTNKINAYNNILNKNELPESTLLILKKDITFKNDGNTIAYDKVVTGLEITGPSFTQVGNGDIEPITIKLLINSDFVVHGDSVNNVTFKTGSLGNVGIIPIVALTEQNKQFDDQLSSALGNILDSKKSYQEMRQTYDSWISDPFKNLPKSILDMFRNNFRFETGAGTVPFFDNIVENLEFVSKTSYPSEPNQKIPDFKITIKLKNDGYIFTNPEQEQILTIENIVINSQTKLIDTSIGNVNNTNIEKAFLDYFNPSDEIVSYQEVRQKFNDMMGEGKTIPNEIRNAISQNIQFNLFGYNPSPQFDDIIDTITIHPLGNAEFPKKANASLPNITINFNIKDQYFTSIDESLLRPIEINLSKVKTGFVEYEVTIDPNLSGDFQRYIRNILDAAKTWQDQKGIFDYFDSYESLPSDAKSLVESGIKFNAVGIKEGEIDLGNGVLNSNKFNDNVKSISLTKMNEFPLSGSEIGTIDLELEMVDNIFHFDDSGKRSNKVYFQSLPLGGVNKPALINVSISGLDIARISIDVQRLIDSDNINTNADVYNRWNKMSDFGPEIENLIRSSIKIAFNGHPSSSLDSILFEQPTIVKYHEYPRGENVPIKLSIKLTLSARFVQPGYEVPGYKNEFLIELIGLKSKGS
ncbi:MAG: hypothetical protein ACRDCF_01580 [Mycoplasmoidaceae bacterium]